MRVRASAMSMIFSAIASSAIAAMLVAGLLMRGVDNVMALSFLSPKLRLPALVAFGIVLAIVGTIAMLKVSCRGVGQTCPAKMLLLHFCMKDIVRATGIILVLWSPWLLLQYPASMPFDTHNQIIQFLTPSPTYYTTMGTYLPGEFIDHHPVFDSLIFGCFYWAGMALGHENVGLVLYSLVQSAATAAMLAMSVCYLERLHTPRRVQGIALVVVCLLPIFPQYATTMLKDPLFSVSYLAFMLCVVHVWRTDCASLGNTRFVACLCASTALACLTKKPGVIVVAVTAVCYLVHYRKSGMLRQMIFSFGMGILLAIAVFPAFIYPLLGGVSPGGRQETLGPLLQQSVTAIVEGGDVTAEEREAIGKVIDLKAAVRRYDPELVDGVKNSFKLDASMSDVLVFLRTWLVVAIRNPQLYAKTTLRCSGPLLLPGWKAAKYYSTPQLSDNRRTLFERKTGISLNCNKPDWAKGASGKVLKWYSRLSNLPVFDVVLSSGLYAWISIAMMLISIAVTRRLPVCWTSQIVSILILLASPVADTRYALPFAYTMVLSGGILCETLWQEQRQRVCTAKPGQLSRDEREIADGKT